MQTAPPPVHLAHHHAHLSLALSPTCPQDMKVEAILRSGIRRFTDEVCLESGRGWRGSGEAEASVHAPFCWLSPA